MGLVVLPALSPGTQDALLRAGRPRRFGAGEVVFHQGDPCDSLFLLREGSVSVHVLTPDGDEVTVGLVVAPDAFGEVGLIRADHHHTASVVALEGVHVLTVRSEVFRELRRDHPDLTEWLLHTVTSRLERMSTLYAEAVFLAAERRVARRLLDCHVALGLGGTRALPLRQEDIAAMAGVARPTANRVLRRLEEQGILRLGRRHIEIRDPAGLAAAGA